MSIYIISVTLPFILHAFVLPNTLNNLLSYKFINPRVVIYNCSYCKLKVSRTPGNPPKYAPVIHYTSTHMHTHSCKFSHTHYNNVYKIQEKLVKHFYSASLAFNLMQSTSIFQHIYNWHLVVARYLVFNSVLCWPMQIF